MPARLFIPRCLSGRRRVVIPPGAVHLWKLEETGATARADSIGALPLTATNSPLNRGGAFSGSMACDFVSASSQHLSRASHADLSPGNTNWMACCWIYPDGAGAQIVCDKRAVSPIEYSLQLADTGDDLYLYLRNSLDTAFTVINIDNIPMAAWSAVAFGHDATNNLAVLRCNGTTATGAHDVNGVASGAGDFYVGAYSGGLHFDGGIDALTIFPGKVLSDSEWTQYRLGTETP